MKTYGAYTDQELAVLLRQGNQAAFSEVYERYWALLLQHALVMLRDDEMAKDTVQDVFYNLWDKAASLEIHTSLSSFLYTSTRYAVLKQIRRSKLEHNYLSTLENVIEQGLPTTDLLVNEKELAKKIEAEIKILPEKMRAVFELSRIHEYSYRQISEALNLSESTVKGQISNALRILRSKLHQVLFLLY